MNLHEAIDLLGLVEAHNIIGGGDYYTDYTSKDVEKCFRQQALRHHPDKGGDASYFQLLHQAKDMLLDHNAGKTMGSASNNCRTSCDANNSTAGSTSLYKHRTCVRQVLMVHDGKRNTVIAAATDDGLTVIELKKDANNCYLLGGLERVVSCTTHRDDCSFLCCTTAVPSSNDDHDDDDDDDEDYVVDVLYAGAKDGFVHKIVLSTRHLTSSWQLPSRERIVAISGLGFGVRDYVGIATADGGIYVLEYQNDASIPTMVWKYRVGAGKWAARGQKTTTCVTMTPETILLEEGSNSDCLNLWVGGSSSSDTVTGRLVMWELDTHEDLLEQYNNDDEVEDLFGEYGIYESDTDSNTSKEPEDDCSNDDERNATLAFDVTVQEGPIFSLSKHKRTIAVTAGQCIIVWDYNNNSNNNITNNPQHQSGKMKKLTKIKTIQTNNQTLYTLCMNERFVAAAGSGESIMVWDRDLWTMVHYLPLQRSPSGCCLATNCIMTLDWFRDDDSRILVSGGYDGVVTMWTLANRLVSNDDTISCGI